MVSIPITEAKAKLLSLVDTVLAGEEIEITRHGRPVARLVPPRRGWRTLRDSMKGVAWTTDPDDNLFSTGAAWEVESE